MQEVLGDFVFALRQVGIPISPAETLDGLKAAELVGIDNASLLKESLALAFIKRLEHRHLYDQVFDRFFRATYASAATEEKVEENNQINNAESDLSSEAQYITDSVTSQLAQDLINNNQSALQVAIAESAKANGAQDMSLFTQIPIVAYKVMQALGDAELNQELAHLQQEPNTEALYALLVEKRTELQQQVRDYVEQQYLLFGQGKPQALRESNLTKIKLTNIDRHYYKKMSELVKKAAKRLASVHSRRRKTTKRGLLDVRKTLSANAAFDGFLFHTKWKSTRIERSKVMIICDVSGSVSKAARFLLLFVHSLQAVMPKVRSFVFASNMGEVTESFKQKDIEDALEEIMADWANRPTSYNESLVDFENLALSDIDNRTTVIMLGDARNNYANGRTDIWEKVYRRSQRVLWLNPENKFSWNSGDSIMQEYAPYCSQVETCNSLRDLNRIIGSLLKYQR